MKNNIISVRNLKKGYNAKNRNRSFGINVLDGISIEIRKGDFIAVIGPNGCGKTTLLKILMGFEKPDSGLISIFGKTPEEARIGYMPQNTIQSLYPWFSSLENVAFAHPAKNKEDAMEKLSEWGISQYANSYPYELSGGLRQLVSIARATFFEPDIFLLDEPFNSLDYQNCFLVEDRLLSLRNGENTAIMVSHDIESAVLLCDKVVVLSEKPTRIKAMLRILLPEKRTLESRFTPEFELISRSVFEILTDYNAYGSKN